MDVRQQGKTFQEADEEICFGAIFGCYAWPSENNLLSKEVLDLPLLGEGFIAFQIRPGDYPKVLRIPGKTRDGLHFAKLDRLSLVLLGAIEKLRRIRFEAIVELEQLMMREESSRATPLAKVLEITINVYGPRSIAKDVRDKLDEVDGYLRHPKALAGGIPYTNPCWFYDDGPDIAWRVGCDNHEHSSWRAKEIDPIKVMFGYHGHRALADAEENASAAMEAEPDLLEQPSLRLLL
ncbi:SNF2 super family RAD5 protein [Colletotrichum sojae]|uniref:SNF2 super family RAD5 protein n=1 Tax=Colletotrichum sojae TaxID=2175907 RepID=A0A8H6J8T7_9PEZI|nr:SNF2 super family RAD5 protein [Colletotrichum sojae]